MRKDNEGNFRTFWFRYDGYEIKEIDEKHYITPKENSKIIMYDPFDLADDILVNILMIGRCVDKNDIEESNKKIMEFVEKYGLLGELTYLPLNTDIVKQNKVYLPSGNLVSEKETLPTDEYIELFLKCKKKQKVVMKKNAREEILDLSVENEMNPLAIIDRPAEYAVVFSRSYSECLVWIMHYARTLYLTFEAIENYSKVKDAYTKQIYDTRIKKINLSKIACKILMGKNKEDKPVLEWNFNSLKLAIDTMFALNETTERKTVKMCKHCGKPFASQNLKAEYCSPQCRNQANVYKSRAKNKEALQKEN